jgi:dCMP deaminase
MTTENVFSSKQNDLVSSWEKSKEPVYKTPWYLYFIYEAYAKSTRSNDPQTQCGCVLVTKDNNVLATGYNGFIDNIDDGVLPNLRPDKYDFMLHAEHNAILSCAKHGKSCDGAIAIVTGVPCLYCWQYMYRVGIQKVFYVANYNKAKMCDESADNKKEILYGLTSHRMLPVPIHLKDKEIEKIEQIKLAFSPL